MRRISPVIHKIMEGCWLGQLNPSRIDTDFLGSSAGKESACNAGDSSSIPGSGSSAGEGIGYPLQYTWASLVAQLVTESTCNAGDLCWIPGLGRSPGEGNSYPHQNSMDRVAWQAAVHRVPELDTTEWLSKKKKRSTTIESCNLWMQYFSIYLGLQFLFKISHNSHCRSVTIWLNLFLINWYLVCSYESSFFKTSMLTFITNLLKHNWSSNIDFVSATVNLLI